MLFPLIGVILGALFGVLRARKLDGNRADQVQWALVYAILFGIAGLFVLIIVERTFF